MTSVRRITANLPRDLLDDAMRATGRGITETLIEGLVLVRRRRVYGSPMALRGELLLDVDLEVRVSGTVRRGHRRSS